MNYVYTLNTGAQDKFGIDSMVVSGWFGYYSKHNKYWLGNERVELDLGDDSIDFIVANSTCEEM